MCSLLVCLAFLLLLSSVLCDETVVTTSLGVVQGSISPDGSARVFRGIPYASPPVGDLRWNAPQPMQPWSGVRNATVDGAGCVQACDLFHPICPPTISEDCLFLNVFTPRLASTSGDELLPVMFFMHGGNFRYGFGGGLLYDGSYITNTTNTIVVAINYRLGAFGFLAVQDTSEGADPAFNGNFGFLDQRMALTFVQENIAAFGGDPKQVTLWGQSAGACSVACHMLSPNSQGLFSQALMESNPFGIPLRTQQEAWELGAAFVAASPCASSSSDVRSCLLDLSWEEVMAAQNATQDDIKTDQRILEGFMPYAPMVGGNEIPMSPYDAWRAGQVPPMPMIVGNTAQEAWIFVYQAYDKSVSLTEAMALYTLIFGVNDLFPLLKEYPVAKGTTDTRQTLSAVATDDIFLCITRNLTRSLIPDNATVSVNEKSSAWQYPIYYYVFDHPQSFGSIIWPDEPYCWNVSCHGSELPFVFHAGYNQYYDWTSEEETLSESIVSYWGNFAHTGNPNMASSKQGVTSVLAWPAYEPSSSLSMHFMTPANMIDTLFHAQPCDFWDSIGYGEQT